MVRFLFILLVLASPVSAQEVLPADKARLTIVLDPLEAEPVEGQMLLATIRGEYRVRIALQDLTLPHSGTFDWVQLARDAWTVEQVDGLPTQVMRRRIAIFPRRAGNLSFPAVEHKLTVVTSSEGRAEHVVTSQPLAIAVRPALGQPWLPVSAIEYSDEWSRDPSSLPMGETVRRRVIIRALGATARMLPAQPALRAPWLISFTAPEQRTTELTPLGPLTTVVWEWSLRPKTGERGVLPDIAIPYFDTSAQAAAVLTLEAAPIGYAAAAVAGQKQTWRSRFTGGWFLAAGLAVGLVLPQLVLGSGGRLLTRGELRDRFGRLWPDPIRRRIRAAARRRDAFALRRAAKAMADAASAEDADTIYEYLLPLDQTIFGEQQHGSVSLKDIARKLADQNR